MQRPAGKAGGSRIGSVTAGLEAELQGALHRPSIAPLIADRDAGGPGAVSPDIDKRYRAPDQVGMRQVQLLVRGGAVGDADIEGADVGVLHAEIDAGAQLRRPPMLVADTGAKGGDRCAADRRII